MLVNCCQGASLSVFTLCLSSFSEMLYYHGYLVLAKDLRFLDTQFGCQMARNAFLIFYISDDLKNLINCVLKVSVS